MTDQPSPPPTDAALLALLAAYVAANGVEALYQLLRTMRASQTDQPCFACGVVHAVGQNTLCSF